jgi:Predicted membrane protein (DUF2207)
MVMNRKSGFRLSLVLIVVAALLVPLSAVYAKSVAWQRYDVDATVQTNGDLRMVETQEIYFDGGPFTSGFAKIPQDGGDSITDISIAENGTAYTSSDSQSDYTFTSYYDSGDLVVEWFFPATSNEARTFSLSYLVTGAVRQYDTGDKVRIAAIGPDFEYPIESSTVTVHLPPGADLINDPDSIGAPVDWQTSLDNRTVTFTSTRAINPNEGIGIELIFRHGAITGPIPAWQAEQDFSETTQPWINLGIWGVSIALLLAVPGVLYLVWHMFGRDPNPNLTPDYIAEPPSDLAPGLVGILGDEKADMRDVTATLVDMARRGLVIFEEGQVTGAFATTAKKYTLRKTGASANMRPYESQLLTAVFGPSEAVELSYMRDAFFTALPQIERAMYDEVVSAGLFRSNPESARSSYRGFGVLMIIGGVLAGCGLSTAFGTLTDSIICLAIPIFTFGLGLVALSGAMPARTRKGADETAKWRAFQKYLGNLQQYKGTDRAAEQFEKFLPYAIAFGLERRFVNAFTAAPATAAPMRPVPIPMWYRPYSTGSTGQGSSIGSGSSPIGGAGPSIPSLNQVGQGFAGGLNSIGENFVGALNAAGRSLSTPNPASTYTYSGGGSRGSSGGRSTFRSGGGGFRGGGFSGGGSRGFR